MELDMQIVQIVLEVNADCCLIPSLPLSLIIFAQKYPAGQYFYSLHKQVRNLSDDALDIL